MAGQRPCRRSNTTVILQSPLTQPAGDTLSSLSAYTFGALWWVRMYLRTHNLQARVRTALDLAAVGKEEALVGKKL